MYPYYQNPYYQGHGTCPSCGRCPTCGQHRGQFGYQGGFHLGMGNAMCAHQAPTNDQTTEMK